MVCNQSGQLGTVQYEQENGVLRRAGNGKCRCCGHVILFNSVGS